MRTIALIAVLCSLPHFLVASDQNLGAQLTAAYAHKGLILLHPVRQNSLRYDSAGKLLSSSEEGPWTLYGPVEVTKIDLTSDKLRIIGKRLIYVYYPKLHEFVAGRQKHPDKVKIEIALGARLNTPEEANAIVNRVFAANPADIVASLPDYWRAYFQRQQETRSAKIVSSGPRANFDQLIAIQKNPGLVRVGEKGVKPPKALFTPEPNYTDSARAMRIQGVCVFSATVGVDGRVHDVHIVRPAGAGLDEQALSVIEKKWKFKPATRDGQPVPVRLSLEVSFNLYK